MNTIYGGGLYKKDPKTKTTKYVVVNGVKYPIHVDEHTLKQSFDDVYLKDM